MRAFKGQTFPLCGWILHEKRANTGTLSQLTIFHVDGCVWKHVEKICNTILLAAMAAWKAQIPWREASNASIASWVEMRQKSLTGREAPHVNITQETWWCRELYHMLIILSQVLLPQLEECPRDHPFLRLIPRDLWLFLFQKGGVLRGSLPRCIWAALVVPFTLERPFLTIMLGIFLQLSVSGAQKIQPPQIWLVVAINATFPSIRQNGTNIPNLYTVWYCSQRRLKQ